MQIAGPWGFVLCIALVLLLLGTTAGFIDGRLWISEPLVCAAVGVAVGPLGLGLLALHVGADPNGAAFMREAARVTLVIAVMGAAMRLPSGWLRRQWRGLAVVLGPGMLAMWGARALITWLVFHLPGFVCLLIGAALAPTDPVLATPVVSGKLAREHISEDLRYGITAESGANDGIALPFVMLPILLLGTGRDPLVHWMVHVVLWEVGTAVAIGVAAGWLTCQLLRWTARHYVEAGSLLTVALALALAVMAAERVLDGDSILAAFVAGAMLNQGYEGEAEKRQERFNEAISRFFDLPVLIIFGAALPWAGWAGMGWRAPAFAMAIVLLRRLPAWLLLRPLVAWIRNVPEALFSGWFGPMGIAALFYALEGQRRTGLSELWPIVSLAVIASIVAHGMTGTPLAALLGPARDAEAEPTNAEPAKSPATVAATDSD